MSEEKGEPTDRGTIKEIIIENFMSYEYARIPLKPGLNIICGPNGSGKSSILLALAVALGQTYTERSRKLSGLIRRGKDMARATVVFNNAPQGGRRPIASCKADEFILSRYLKQDGTYWHEAGFRSATKAEVTRILSRLNINPSNMLIIMHQNMIEEFSVIDNREKLKMVEEAVGLREYREKIFEARERLSHMLSEEEAVENLLDRARETLDHWEGEYNRYLRKKELMEEKKRLTIEYAWSKCVRVESGIEALRSKVKDGEEELREIGEDLEKARREEGETKTRIAELDYDLEKQHQNVIIHERMKVEAQTKLKIYGEFLNSFPRLYQGREKQSEENLERIRAEIADSKQRLRESEGNIDSTNSSIVKLRMDIEKERERYVDVRVKEAILEFRRELLARQISQLKRDIGRSVKELNELLETAERLGPRVETHRKPIEILDEIKIVNAQLSGLTDVSSDAEKMYVNYKNLLDELKQKAEIAAINRKRALRELGLRERKWRETLTNLLSNVGETYREILRGVNATGDARLVNMDDVEEAGLELLVGFRGATPTILDAYTQSGGERTTAVMCFLLALQQHVKSPIRAVDEFDVHMDPRNREDVMKQLFRHAGKGGQYLIITPGQIVNVEGKPNIITVQNVGGASRISVVA